MRIKNTSRYPDERVREILAFAARGIRDSGVEVHVKNSSYIYAGTFYQSAADLRDVSSSICNAAECLIVVRIGAPDNFPIRATYPGLKTAPEMEYRSWEEALVGVAAHEFCHLKQYRRGKRYSDVAAERWAKKCLEEFRAAGRRGGLRG